MRISGGIYGGRAIAVPKGDAVRPTQDMVRQALFSMLQAEVPGASFLDLFAGSGAVGLEALSRGAARVTGVEREPRHLAVLRANLESLKVPPAAYEAVRADACAWIRTAGRARAYDIAYADPPYALGEELGCAEFLGPLAENGVVRPGGLCVVEMRASGSPVSHPAWELLRDRRYGQTRLAVYRRVR